MIKHIINFLTVGGFMPFLTAFYVANNDGGLQLVYTALYALILAIAIKLNQGGNMKTILRVNGSDQIQGAL